MNVSLAPSLFGVIILGGIHELSPPTTIVMVSIAQCSSQFGLHKLYWKVSTPINPLLGT